MLLLGPLAVQPNLRGQGYGHQIVEEGLARAKAMGKWQWCWCPANQNIIQNLVLCRRTLSVRLARIRRAGTPAIFRIATRC